MFWGVVRINEGGCTWGTRGAAQKAGHHKQINELYYRKQVYIFGPLINDPLQDFL